MALWSADAYPQPPAESAMAIPPGSPPSEQQKQFALLPTGIRVFDPPEQYAITDFKWLKRGSFELGYTDRIFMRGLVLSVQPYTVAEEDDMAEISMVDVVIGWQRMSDPAVVSQIHIRQRDRFYYWRVESFPIPREEIERNSTNIHIIADSMEQMAALAAIKPGDVVSLEGYLTDVKKPDGFIWNTSRVRDDQGDGACEILLLHHLSIIQPAAPSAQSNHTINQ